MAGYTLANAGTVIVHAMAHTIGAWAKIPHGVANTLCLMPVMSFFADRVPELVGSMAEPLGANTTGDDVSQAQAAIEAMQELIDAVGLPTRMGDAGVERSWLPEVAKITHGTRRLMDQSPAQPTIPELEMMLEAVY